MPNVGRPRTTTDAGSRAPTSELGVPYISSGTYGGGILGVPGLMSGSGPWRMYIDEWELIPELMWPTNVNLFQQMRTDEQLAGLLTSVMWGIAQLRYTVDPNGAPRDMVEKLSTDLNLPIMGEEPKPLGRRKGRFSHGKHVINAMLACIYGHMYFEQVGVIQDGMWRLRKLAPRLPHTIRQINVSDDGGLVSIQQWAAANQVQNGIAIPEIPVDRLVAFIFQQEGMSWTGRSMLRDVYRSWLLKDRLLRVEAINHERAGGVPYANAAQGATVDEIADLDQMMRNFRIGESAGGALPFGAELSIAKGSNSDIDATIKRLDEGMARKFLLMVVNLAQGGQHVGSYALGETFEDFFIIGQRHIAQWYCDVMTEHVIEDWVDWNYGEDTELTPQLTWERSSEDSLGVDQLSEMVNKGVITMDQETENWVRYRYMLPKKTEPRPEVSLGGPRQPFEQRGQAQGGQSGTIPDVTPSATPSPSQTAASGAAPSPVAAAFRQAWARKKPDVMASATFAEPRVMTVRDVPVMEAGVEYPLSTGPTTFTPEDLADAAAAINEDRSIPAPRLGIGHVDPRFNGDDGFKVFDGEPTWGTLTNARISDNGMIMIADYEGVPEWLAKLMPYAFPSRSIEGFWNITSQMGRTYRFVLSACKVLGVTWPGINQLEDLPRYYGEEPPDDVVVSPALLAAAAAHQPGGDPMKWPFNRQAAASANLDDVRRQFYGRFVKENPTRARWWIRQVLVDPNEIVAEDDETGQLYRIAYATMGDGIVTFSDGEAVRISLVPDDKPELLKAAASASSELLAVGRTVLASYDSPANSVPEEPASGGAMDPKEVRAKLGLAEDASDAQVQEALLARLEAEPEGDPAPQTPPATPPADPEPEPTPAQDPPSNVVPFPVPEGAVLVDKAQWEQLNGQVAQATSFVQSQQVAARERLVDEAIKEGRIAPSSKEHWLNLLDKDPNGGQVLASLAPGLVPVTERGHSHSPDPARTLEVEAETVSQWTGDLFPEVRAAREAEAALAAAGGQFSRPRIQSDADYGHRR